MILQYIGDGSGLINVPARSLDQADLTRLKQQLGVNKADLIASGLYKEAPKKSGKKSDKEAKDRDTKILNPSQENKGA